MGPKEILDLLEAGRTREAIRACRNELHQNPENVEAKALLAWCLIMDDQDSEAVGVAEEAIGSCPGLSYGHFVLGVALMNLGHVHRGEASLRRALEMEPDNPQYLVYHGFALGHMGHWNAALTAAEDARRLEPESEEATQLRIQALQELGRPEEAEEAISGSAGTDEPLLEANLGWQRLRAGDYEDSAHHFKRALSLEPDFDHAQDGLVHWLRIRTGFYRNALAFWSWAENLSFAVRTLLVFGAFLGAFTIGQLQNLRHPAAPVVVVLLMVYVAFVLLVVGRGALLDMCLLLHPLGRLALPKLRRRYASLLSLTTFLSAFGLVGGWVTGEGLLLVMGGMFGICLMMFVGVEMIPDVRRRLLWGWVAFTSCGLIVAATAVIVAFDLIGLKGRN